MCWEENCSWCTGELGWACWWERLVNLFSNLVHPQESHPNVYSFLCWIQPLQFRNHSFNLINYQVRSQIKSNRGHTSSPGCGFMKWRTFLPELNGATFLFELGPVWQTGTGVWAAEQLQANWGQCNHEQRVVLSTRMRQGTHLPMALLQLTEDGLLIRGKKGQTYPTTLVLSLPALQHSHTQYSREHLQGVFVNRVSAGQGRTCHKGVPAPSHLTEGPRTMRSLVLPKT